MNLLVVGAGSIGRRHIKNLLAIGVPATDIKVLDINREVADRVCQEFNVKPLEGQGLPSAVLICTPATQHAEWIRSSIEARIPFFVEKPATVGLHELSPDEWSTNVPHLVGCNMIFRPEVSDFIRRATEPSSNTQISIWCQADMTTWPGQYTAPPVFEFCHEIDIADRINGGIDLPTVRGHHIQTGGVMISCFTVRNKLPVTISLKWHDAGYRRGAIMVRMGHESGYAWGRVPVDVNEMYVEEMRHFVNVAKGTVRSLNTLADARRVVAVCEKVLA